MKPELSPNPKILPIIDLRKTRLKSVVQLGARRMFFSPFVTERHDVKTFGRVL